MGAALTLLAVLLLVGTHAASASAASCSGSSCTSQDPYATGCNNGDSVAGSAAIVDRAGQTIGEIKLYWSSACQANWGQAYFNDGNPPNTPPVDIKVVGSSSSAAYDMGPVDFTTTASGSPVWGNMVYSPGCAYTTVTRGDATGQAVQVGCPTPGQSTGPPGQSSATPGPSGTKCSGATCTGQDPYATACSTDAVVLTTSPVTDGGQTIGDVKLFWSPACQTNWAQADFSDGNPASTPPVDIKVVGSSSSAAYDNGPVDFITTGSGSPVWGNMVYSPGCGVAYVTRGSASGQAAQTGCSPAPPGRVTTSPYTLAAIGNTFSVTGGSALTGTVADFTDPDQNATPADFVATIDWGDGTQSEGTVSGSPGDFAVQGEHLYADPTQQDVSTAQGYQINVTIRDISGGPDGGGGTATAQSSVEVIGRGVSPPPPDQGSQPPVVPSTSDKPQAGGLGIFGAAAAVTGCGVSGVADFFTFGALTPLTGFACAGAAADVGATIITLDDPPDRHFHKVFRARPLSIPHIPKSCGRLTGARCVSLRAAVVKYLRAYALASALTEDVGVTANRYGGALAAHNSAAAKLQRNAEARYFPRWVAATKGRQAAGRALGMLLIRDGLDRRIPTAQIASGRARLVALTGVSAGTLSRLKREGLISAPADVAATYQRFLAQAPRPHDAMLSSLLSL